jgi:hypothetical protein
MRMIYASMHSLITALLSHHMKPIGRLHVPDRYIWRVEPPCYVEPGAYLLTIGPEFMVC